MWNRIILLLCAAIPLIYTQSCVRYYSALKDETCESIAALFATTEDALQKLNPSLDCARLEGTRICIARRHKVLAACAKARILEDCTLSCSTEDGQMHLVDWRSHDCRVEENATVEITATAPAMNCTAYYESQAHETCDGAAAKFHVSMDQLITLNPALQYPDLNYGLKCTNIQRGERLCVSNSTDLFSVDQRCGKLHEVSPGESCWAIYNKYGLTLAKLMQINSEINCDLLQIGQKVCVRVEGDEPAPCSRYVNVKAGDDCYSHWTRSGISEELFFALNTDIDCNLLQVGQRICVGSGVFNASYCSRTTKIRKGDTCFEIAKSNGILLDRFMQWNSKLNCDNLPDGGEVCVADYGGQNGEKTLEDFVAGLSSASTELAMSYAKLQQTSKSADRLNFFETMATQLVHPEVHRRINEIYRSNSQLKEAMEAQAGNRSHSCEQMKSTGFSSKVKHCFCTSSEAFVYCQALAFEQIQSVTERRRRSIPPISCDFTKLWQKATFAKQCTSLDCSMIVLPPLVSLGVSAQICNPTFKFTGNLLTMCIKEDCKTYPDTRDELLKELMSSTTSFAASLCLDFHKILTLLGTPCLNLVQIDFAPFVGTLEITAGVSVIGFALTAGGVIKTNDMVMPQMCQRSAFECEDCCVFQHADTPNGNGFFKVQLKAFSLFGFEGVPLIDVKINRPKKYGCEKGEVAIFIKSARSCEEFIHVRCQSKDDDIGAKEIRYGQGFEFGFQPHFFGKSVFWCEFVNPTNGDKIGFDVYGGTSRNKGKSSGNFHYSITNKGVRRASRHVVSFEETVECRNKRSAESEVREFDPHFKNLFEQRYPKIENKNYIALYNVRPCADDVWVQCQSGEDTLPMTLLRSGELYAFDFNTAHKTLFYCTFEVAETGERKAFDVFGGDRTPNGGKVRRYDIEMSGVSFYESNDLWEFPESSQCADPSKEDPSDVDSSEPTGTSSVPAAKCGKRIVGYYTAWGKRGITLEQVKSLTHVIFAFVHLGQNADLSFAKVGEDREGGPTESPEGRFKNLKNMVRRAASGTKILIAFGGWDNSEHFSNIAGNKNLRDALIENIANFVDEKGVDGVDIDWEYPVTGGAQEGVPEDRSNYVILLRDLRTRLDRLAEMKGRTLKYEISIASAAGQWTLDPGYDLPNIIESVDFINVMTYDYYGAWESKWGAFTGPPAPLYSEMPKGFSGKLNADFTLKYYACRSKKPSKINMGVPFYGRYWENVGDAADPKDPMWRTARDVGGRFLGGALSYREIVASDWNIRSTVLYNGAKAPFIWDSARSRFLGYENPESLSHKIRYATEKNLGGVMIWAIDQDTEADDLLRVVSRADFCSGGSGDSIAHKCSPITGPRWWTPETGPENHQGKCGRSAPLFEGFYPVCDPDDPGYACCSSGGYCGSGEEFCTCDTCVDYSNVDNILKEPVKPTISVHVGECASWKMRRRGASDQRNEGGVQS